MLASMLVQGPPRRQLTVDAAAVVREENRDYVFVKAEGNAYRLTRVELGAQREGRRVVLTGLREGEPVVADGAFHLNNERKRLELAGS